VQRAELPYDEVLVEVDRFVRAMEGTAGRAQLLYEALAETPPDQAAARLAEVERSGEGDAASSPRRSTARWPSCGAWRASSRAFYAQMERILVELDTVRGNLVSVSDSTDAANQEQLATEVRGLREEVGALAEGMSEAYERPSGGVA